MNLRLWHRCADLGLALALAPAWVPLLGCAWLLARVGQGRPVFYRAERLGRHGRPFLMRKFRTMVREADQIGPQVADRTDPRVTRVGRLLRATKLDELPQFLHVLGGSMAMAGPRPESPAYLPHFGEAGWRSLRVKPGITGPGAIAFFFLDQAAGSEPFANHYIRTLLPLKLRLDAQCADQLQRRPLRTTLGLIGWTLVAVACRLLHRTPPARIRLWCATDAPAPPSGTIPMDSSHN